jgi:hypothetical protein
MKRSIISALTLIGALALGIFLGLNQTQTYAAATPEEAARADLPMWMDSIRTDYQVYGFNSEEELQAVELGQPLQVHILSAQALENYQPGNTIEDLVDKNLLRWVFPLVVGGESRGILTVAFFEGRWQAIEIGNLPLGQRILQLQNKEKEGKKEILGLVEFGPTRTVFALTSKKDRIKVVHLQSLPGIMPTIERQNFTEYDGEVALPELRDALREMLRLRSEQQQFTGTPTP